MASPRSAAIVVCGGLRMYGRQGGSNKLTTLANKATAPLDWMKTLFSCCGHGILSSPHGRSRVQVRLLPPVALGQAEGTECSRRKSLLALYSPQTVPCRVLESEGQPGGEPGLLHCSRLSEPQTCRRAAVATACDALGTCTCSWVVRAQSISQARK